MFWNTDLRAYYLAETVVESRWDATKEIAGRDMLIAAAGLHYFLILTAINFLLITDGTLLHTVVDRLSTAMFTAMIVSALTIYYSYRESVPVIQWTTSYERR